MKPTIDGMLKLIDEDIWPNAVADDATADYLDTVRAMRRLILAAGEWQRKAKIFITLLIEIRDYGKEVNHENT